MAAQLPTLLVAALALAVLLGSAAGDTEADRFVGQTFLFWLSHTLTGLLLMSGVTRALTGRLPTALPGWVQLLIGGLLGALCFAPLALLLEHGFALIGYGDSDLQALEDSAGAFVLLVTALAEFVNLAPPFVLSWLLLNLGYQSQRGVALAPPTLPTPESGSVLTETPQDPDGAQGTAGPKEATVEGAEERVEEVSGKPPETDHETAEIAADTDDPAVTGLFALLAPALGQEIQLLSADLNYVHVVTAQGKAMVLYSLTRAARELGDRGLQVHRSHWVSKPAVAAVRRTGKGLQIELRDGTKVPVSRRKERLVREEFGQNFRSHDESPKPVRTGP